MSPGFHLRHWIGRASALTGEIGSVEDGHLEPSRGLTEEETVRARDLAQAARTLAGPHRDDPVSVEAIHHHDGGCRLEIRPVREAPPPGMQSSPHG